MASTSAIPLDVIEVIIDILADNKERLNFNTLKACCLVCKTVIPFCRKHLFAFIQFNAVLSTRTSRAFIERVMEAPDIAQYIRKVDFCIQSHGMQESFSSFPKDILQRLTRVQSLDIFWNGRDKVDWKDISSPMRSSLLQLMHLPSVVHLKLRGIGSFPISSLIPCTSLKCLHIEFLDIVANDHDFLSMVPSESIRLQEFHIRVHGTTMAQKLWRQERPILDFTYLTKFSVSLSGPQDRTAFEIFKFAQALTDLHLIVWDTWERSYLTGFANMISPFLGTLKNVRLEIHTRGGYGSDPLLGLCNELYDVAGKNILQTLTIIVQLQAHCTCTTGDEWAMLERALLRPGWSDLKPVSLQIIFSDDSYEDKDALEMELRQLPEMQFPRLSSDKTLDFRFAVSRILV